MKKHIPNIITLLNLLSGLIALVYVFDNNLIMGFFWVCMGIFFDFWDGFAARKLKVSSSLGLQLDSLADMVTSGVVPGLAMFKMLSNILENKEITSLSSDTYYLALLPYIGFVITIGACLRLAKFNIDTRQTDSFIGLPTPANALFILSLPMIAQNPTFEWETTLIGNPYFLSILSILSALIMNSEIHLFSLKMKKKSPYVMIFVILSAILLIISKYEAIPIIIISYILMSIIKKKEA